MNRSSWISLDTLEGSRDTITYKFFERFVPPFPSFSLLRIVPAAPWLFLFLLLPSSPALGEEKQPQGIMVQGEAMGSADPEILLERARRDGFTNGLVRYLKETLTPEELASYEALLKRYLLSKPEGFVAEVSGETTLPGRNRVLYRALVRYDTKKIEEVLGEIGVRNPYDRPPLVYYTLANTEGGFSPSLSRAVEALLLTLKEYGISLTEGVGEGVASARITVQKVQVPHPLAPEIPVVRVPMEFELLAGQRQERYLLYPDTDPFSPPLREAVLPLVLRIYELWEEGITQRLRERTYTLGPLPFPDLKAWQNFHQAISARPDLFHNLRITRITKEKGYLVEYRFSLNPGEEANARAWLMNQGWKLKENERRFFP